MALLKIAECHSGNGAAQTKSNIVHQNYQLLHITSVELLPQQTQHKCDQLPFNVKICTNLGKARIGVRRVCHVICLVNSPCHVQCHESGSILLSIVPKRASKIVTSASLLVF